MIRKLLLVFVSILVMLNLITPISASIHEEDEKFEIKNKSFTVCIDPGHQGKGDEKGEPVLQVQAIRNQEYHQEQLELLQKRLSML